MHDETERVLVRSGDRAEPLVEGAIPVVVFLDSLRSAFNVGNIFRLADATCVRLILTCGCTATPPHPKLSKTARGCEQRIPSRHCPDAAAELSAWKTQGYRVYAVETAVGATPVWSARFRFPAVLVLGNEAHGISAAALSCCDECIELPCFGVKNSINVGNCAAVVLYTALAQWLGQEQSSPPGPSDDGRGRRQNWQPEE